MRLTAQADPNVGDASSNMTSVAYSFMSMDNKSRNSEESHPSPPDVPLVSVTTSRCPPRNYDCNGPQYPKLLKRKSKKISSVYIATTKEKVGKFI